MASRRSAGRSTCAGSGPPPGPASLIRRPPSTGDPRPIVATRCLGLWAFLTTFAVFEVVKHGYVNGTATDAALLTAEAGGAAAVEVPEQDDDILLPTVVASADIPGYSNGQSVPATASAIADLMHHRARGLGDKSGFISVASNNTPLEYDARNPDGSRDRTWAARPDRRCRS